MYATLSYDVTAGSDPIEDVRAEILKLFKNRDTCDLLSDTFICSVDDAEDYLELVKKLRQLGTDFSGQFQFVVTLHEPTDPLRSNARFPRDQAKKIMKAED